MKYNTLTFEFDESATVELMNEITNFLNVVASAFCEIHKIKISQGHWLGEQNKFLYEITLPVKLHSEFVLAVKVGTKIIRKDTGISNEDKS